MGPQQWGRSNRTAASLSCAVLAAGPTSTNLLKRCDVWGAAT